MLQNVSVLVKWDSHFEQYIEFITSSRNVTPAQVKEFFNVECVELVYYASSRKYRATIRRLETPKGSYIIAA